MPYRPAIASHLHVQTANPAMTEMNKRFDLSDERLNPALNRMLRGKDPWTHRFQMRPANAFVTCNDLQSHLLSGDPAAPLRILQ